MDSNKDEAERCMELAERFMRERKYEEAEKFARKAQKLYPTKKAEGTWADGLRRALARTFALRMPCTCRHGRATRRIRTVDFASATHVQME